MCSCKPWSLLSDAWPRASIKLATRDGVKCRQVMTSPQYQRLWGHRFRMRPDQNQKTRFDNLEGGHRISTSEGGVITGEGGDIIVFDDQPVGVPRFGPAQFSAANGMVRCTRSPYLPTASRGAVRPTPASRRSRSPLPAVAGMDRGSLDCETSNRRCPRHEDRTKVGPLCDLHPQVNRSGARAGLQLA